MSEVQILNDMLHCHNNQPTGAGRLAGAIMWSSDRLLPDLIGRFFVGRSSWRPAIRTKENPLSQLRMLKLLIGTVANLWAP